MVNTMYSSVNVYTNLHGEHHVLSYRYTYRPSWWIPDTVKDLYTDLHCTLVQQYMYRPSLLTNREKEETLVPSTAITMEAL